MQGLGLSLGAARPQAAPLAHAARRGFALSTATRRQQPLAPASRRGCAGCFPPAAARCASRLALPAAGASAPLVRCRLRAAPRRAPRLLLPPLSRPLLPRLALPRARALPPGDFDAPEPGDGSDEEEYDEEEEQQREDEPFAAQTALPEAVLRHLAELDAAKQRVADAQAAQLDAEEAEFEALKLQQPTEADWQAEEELKAKEEEEAIQALMDYAKDADPSQVFADAMMTAFPLPLLQLAERYEAEEGEEAQEGDEVAWKQRARAANDHLMERLQAFKNKIDRRHKREAKTVVEYFQELDEESELLGDLYYQLPLRMKLVKLMDAGKSDMVMKIKVPREAKVLMEAIDSGDPTALLKVLLGMPKADAKEPKRRRRGAGGASDEENATPDFDAERDARGRAAAEGEGGADADAAFGAQQGRLGEGEQDGEYAEAQYSGEEDEDSLEEENEIEDDDDEIEYEERNEYDSDEEEEDEEEEQEEADADDDDFDEEEDEEWDEEADEDAQAQEAEMQRVLSNADAEAGDKADAGDEEGEDEDEAGDAFEGEDDDQAEPAADEEGRRARPREPRLRSPMYGRELWWVLERTQWSSFKILGLEEGATPGVPVPVNICGVTDTLEHDSNNEVFFCYEENPKIALAVAAIALQVFDCAAVVIKDFDNSQAAWLDLEQPGPVLLVKDVHAAFLDFTKTFYEDPSASMTCIGVCGNVGTSTKAHLIQAVMQSTGQISGLMTPLSYEVGPTPVPPTLPPEFKDDMRTVKRKPGMRRNKSLILPKWAPPKRLSRRGDIFIPKMHGAIAKEEKRWTTTPYFLSLYKGKYTRPGIRPLRPVEMTRVLAGFVAQGAESAAIELTPLNCAAGMAEHTRFDVLVFTGLTRESDETTMARLEDEKAAELDAAAVAKAAEERAEEEREAAKGPEFAAAYAERRRAEAKEARLFAERKKLRAVRLQQIDDAEEVHVEAVQRQRRRMIREGQGPNAMAAAEAEADEAAAAFAAARDVIWEEADDDGEEEEEFTGPYTLPLVPVIGSGFDDWADYRDTVASVFRSQCDIEQQRAVVNVDDPEARFMMDNIGGAKVLTYVGELYEDLTFLVDPDEDVTDEDDEEDDLDIDDRIRTFVRVGAEGLGDLGPAVDQEAWDKARGAPTVADFAAKTPRADVYPVSIEVCIWDTKVEIQTPLGRVEIISRLLGREVLSDITAAVAVGVATGVPLASIKEALEGFRGVPGRMMPVDEGQPFAVVVDSARTPDQIHRVITTMRDLGAQNIITVVGAKWFTSKQERNLIGSIAHEYSDTLIITNDDPNTENEFKILTDIASGFFDDVVTSREMLYREPRMPSFNFMRDWADIALDANHERETDPWLAMQWQSNSKRFVIAERFHAIRAALGFANDGDAVLLLGKGAQDYQIVGAAKWWFDDWCEATDALRVLGSPSMANLKLDMKQLPYRMKSNHSERKGVGGVREATRGGAVDEFVPSYLTEDYDEMPEMGNYIERLMDADDEFYGEERWADIEDLFEGPQNGGGGADWQPKITEEMLANYARERANAGGGEEQLSGEADDDDFDDDEEFEEEEEGGELDGSDESDDEQDYSDEEEEQGEEEEENAPR